MFAWVVHFAKGRYTHGHVGCTFRYGQVYAWSRGLYMPLHVGVHVITLVIHFATGQCIYYTNTSIMHSAKGHVTGHKLSYRSAYRSRRRFVDVTLVTWADTEVTWRLVYLKM